MPLVSQVNVLGENDSHCSICCSEAGHARGGTSSAVAIRVPWSVGTALPRLGSTGGHGEPRLAVSVFNPKTHPWGPRAGQHDGAGAQGRAVGLGLDPAVLSWACS